jgi:hypothetical protein
MDRSLQKKIAELLFNDKGIVERIKNTQWLFGNVTNSIMN